MKVIKDWRKATEQIAVAFTKKYFKREIYGKDTFWVADRIGDIFFVSDYYFDVDRMVEALELKATFDQLIGFYDFELECSMNNQTMQVNFNNYVKSGIKLFINSSASNLPSE